MSPEEKEMVRQRIVKRLRRVNDDIVYLEDATKPISPENAIGRVSRMDAINNKGVSEAALRSAKITREKLEVAMNEIDTEDFGKCKRCKEPIAVKRILLMPESDRCVKCANRI